MSKASPLGLRLFLEGVEVPVIAAQVTADPNKASVASVQVIPSGMGLHLLPRTLVHLFFLDEPPGVFRGQQAPGDTFKEAVERVDAADAGVTSLNRITSADANYKLMFCGEVIGFNYSKTPNGRQLVLQCMDLSSYWDTCYQWFADYAPGGTALTDKAHMFVGAGEGLFDNVASGTKWVIGNLLRSPPRTPEYQSSRGLMGGVIRLMEAVGGLRYRDKIPGTHGVNDFFTIAELRYNLLGQLGALEGDTTSANLYNRKAFFDWLRHGMTSLGNLISFRDVINHVNRYIFHEVFPNPCPRYLSGAAAIQAKKFKKKESTVLEDDRVSGTTALEAMRRTNERLTIAFLQYDASRLKIGSVVTARANQFQRAVRALQEAKKEALRAESWVERTPTGDAKSVLSDLKGVTSKIDEALKETVNQTSDLAKRAGKALELIKEAQETLISLSGMKHRAKNTSASEKVEVQEGDRLFTQLFLPDCYFVPPPRCNVIFPDEYFSFNFSRNFMREVTRLSCQGGLGIISGGDNKGAALLGRHYFAPNVRDAAGRNLRVTLQEGGRVLMRHETHSGIIPKFSWITQGHRWGVKAANKKGEVKLGNKISYVQRLSNFQFFLHRWASRTMNLSCVFKPSLVLGLPALVIDKHMSMSGAVQSAFSEKLGRAYVPPQFLGKVAHLDHNITQNGGQTTVVLNYCRLHQGLDDEFLGTLYDEKLGEEDIESFDVNYETMSKDPNYKRGQRAELTGLLKLYLDGRLKKDQPLRTVGTTRVVKAGPTFRVTGSPLANLGLPARLTVGDRADIPKTLYVEIGVKSKAGEFIRKKGVKAEDTLRPGWFSADVWSNENVGTKVYQFLLGCYSITDDVPVSSQELQQRIKDLKDSGIDVGGLGGAAFANAEARKLGEERVKFLESAGDSLGYVVEGSIEEAVNAIAAVYGEIRNNENYNVHEFIRNFTYRPIATLEEILGSKDLAFGDDGEPADDTMVEGFHSRAYGDYNADVVLPTKEDVETEPGTGALDFLFRGVPKGEGRNVKMKSFLDRGEPQFGLRPEFDPRGRARARVKLYAAEMEVTRGLSG